MGKNSHKELIAAALLTMSIGTVAAADDCPVAKGKIVNNVQPDGSTLGVVALVLNGIKTKCAIVGKPQASLEAFHHTLVCENPAAPGQPQDQITFHSTVDSRTYTEECSANPASIPYAFSFTESSTVVPGSGRGTFAGVEVGAISISGNFNCSGGIRMQFEGYICPAPQ